MLLDINRQPYAATGIQSDGGYDDAYIYMLSTAQLCVKYEDSKKKKKKHMYIYSALATSFPRRHCAGSSRSLASPTLPKAV